MSACAYKFQRVVGFKVDEKPVRFYVALMTGHPVASKAMGFLARGKGRTVLDLLDNIPKLLCVFAAL